MASKAVESECLSLVVALVVAVASTQCFGKASDAQIVQVLIAATKGFEANTLSVVLYSCAADWWSLARIQVI